MGKVSSLHALIIDDNDMNALVLRKLVESEGLAVSVIAHPADIPAVLPTLPPLSVVFLDLEMPENDGYEVLAYLREQLGDRARIVAYTVHTGESVTAWQKGFDGFLGKPLNRKDFSDHLRRILSGERVWAVT